jgi:hypothetical protein
MNNIQLHVGYIGITREGKRVEITKSRTSGCYPWRSSNGNTYDSKGYLWNCDKPTNRDIIGPWVETPVEPLPNYNDGNWHRWDGATSECPVHGDSLVEVNYIYGGYELRYARNYCWNSSHGPIVAFRVTKEYVAPVEPREFWVELDVIGGICKTHKAKTKDFLGTTLVHVREVI